MGPKLLLAGLLMALCGCTGVEEKRIRELLVEKGFGTRAQGVATVENYVAGGDKIVFFLDRTLLLQPGYEQLALLTQPQTVGVDGTIAIPYVGSVPVLSLNEREIEQLVTEQLQAIYNTPIKLTARILNFGKVFYMFGEIERKGRLPFVKGDLTVVEAIAAAEPTKLANLGRVMLIRPDAQNPLVTTINYREMITTGLTRYNLLVQDNDFIYVPPTFFGTLTRFIEKLLEPVRVVVSALFGIASARASYNYAIDNNGNFGGRPFFFGF